MGLKSGYYQRTTGEMQSLVFKWKIVLLTDSFLFYMKPALIILLFFAYISILLLKSMVSFTFDCFGLCFFPHQNVFLKSVKSFHNLLSLLHVDTNTYMKFVMEESQRLVFVIFVIYIYL